MPFAEVVEMTRPERVVLLRASIRAAAQLQRWFNQRPTDSVEDALAKLR